MSIATTAPQRSQGMILLSITPLASGTRVGGSTGPTSSGVAPKAASICRDNSSPKGLKIVAHCVVIGSDGSPTTSQEIWQRPSSNSCSKMRPNSPSTRCRKTYAQASARRCFSKDTSGGNRKPVLLFQAGDALCSAPLRADRRWTRESLILRLPLWRESVISQGPGRRFECSR